MSPSRTLVVVVLGSVLGIGAFFLFVGVGEPSPIAEAATPELPSSPAAAPEVTEAPNLPTSTTAEAPEEPGRGWLVIHAVGDVALDPAYIPNLARRGYEYAFSGLNGMFRGDDVTIANLECAPSHLGHPVEKDFTFRCDPDALAVAAGAGIEVFNLANNHSQDFGLEALLDGRGNAEVAGLGVVGVGVDLAEALSPAVVDTDGWRVAVLGFGAVIPSTGWLATDDRPGMASGTDLPTMTAAVAAAADGADVVVVTIHWGHERETEPSAEMVTTAEALVTAGADVIFGHHQHRLNPLTFVGGKPVAWGLGNFVWPRLSYESATTAIARVVFSPDGQVSACLIPAFIEESGHPAPTGPASCGSAESPHDPSILDASS